ncbi:MAG: amidophosphoribosyltransferase [SAR324 cluster bacterium]|nr:amidophosphoribosyltransferase [SAR324 cluster bacterium]
MDRLNEECGIVAVYDLNKGGGKKNVAPIVVRALLEMQNRGQLSAGLTSYNPTRDRILQTHKELGSVHEVFSLNNPFKSKRLMAEYAGHAAIGHNRYATSGAMDSAQAQPFERMHGRMWKWFAIGFNGNLANYESMKRELEGSGYHITYHADTEVMMHHINRELRGDDPPDFKELFANLASIFDGAYNITFINAAGDMVVMRDPLGIKPLCYAEKDGLLVAASESVVLTNMGFESYQDLQPGELLVANADGYRVERYWPEEQRAHCFFEWVYFSNLASNLDGRSVYKVREAIGRELAKQEILPDREEHLVLAVPETAETVANTFAFNLGLKRVNGLLRNRYVGRTFIDGVNRGENVRLKFTPLREVIEGKKIFLVDDTLVRGTTLKTVVEELRERGKVKEVHVRIGNPPIMGPCFYGIDMPTVQELFAPPFLNGTRNGEVPPEILERMAAAIGADSLSYLSIKKLVIAVGLPKQHLCMACLNNDYPTPVGQERYKEALRNAGM